MTECVTSNQLIFTNYPDKNFVVNVGDAEINEFPHMNGADIHDKHGSPMKVEGEIITSTHEAHERVSSHRTASRSPSHENNDGEDVDASTMCTKSRAPEQPCDVLAQSLHRSQHAGPYLLPHTLRTILRRHDAYTIDWSRVCLLDMQAERELTPEDAASFDLVVLGGILGNITHEEDGTYGSDDRTKELRDIGFAHRRHLGPWQMTTDTALLVSKLVLEDKQPLDSVPYIDEPDIDLGNNESIQMEGFRYVEREGLAVIPHGMLEHWIEAADDDIFG